MRQFNRISEENIIREFFLQHLHISKDVCNVGNLNGEKGSYGREEKKTLIGEKPFGKEGEEDADLRKELLEPFGKADSDLRKGLGGEHLTGEEKLGGQTQEKENSQISVGEDVKGGSEETRDGFEKAKHSRGPKVKERREEVMEGGGKNC